MSITLVSILYLAHIFGNQLYIPHFVMLALYIVFYLHLLTTVSYYSEGLTLECYRLLYLVLFPFPPCLSAENH